MKHIRDNVYEHNGIKLCAIMIPESVSGIGACNGCPVRVSCYTQFSCSEFIGVNRVFRLYKPEYDNMNLNFKCVVPTAKDLGDMVRALAARNLVEHKKGESWQYSMFVGFENTRFLQTSEAPLFCGWSMELVSFQRAMEMIKQTPEVIKLQPKFKFRINEPVLVRNGPQHPWCLARYAFMLDSRFNVVGGIGYRQMIQYETNKQLLGRCVTPGKCWEIDENNKLPVWKETV